jgi:hypothetical protein
MFSIVSAHCEANQLQNNKQNASGHTNTIVECLGEVSLIIAGFDQIWSFAAYK